MSKGSKNRNGTSRGKTVFGRKRILLRRKEKKSAPIFILRVGGQI